MEFVRHRRAFACKSRIFACPRRVTKTVGRLIIAVNNAIPLRGIKRVGNFGAVVENQVVF